MEGPFLLLMVTTYETLVIDGWVLLVLKTATTATSSQFCKRVENHFHVWEYFSAIHSGSCLNFVF